MTRTSTREFLIDVSRLIWRSWRGRPPTGIDRVCLAYLEHFGPRSQAVVQRHGRLFALTPGWSDRLRSVLLHGSGAARLELLTTLLPALATARAAPPRGGMTYLNVGHTGLDEPKLVAWIRKHQVRAIHLVHDLIPLTHPQYCRPGEAARHERRMSNALASASGVIANSRDTLYELTRFAASQGMDMPPSVVAWLGVEAICVDHLGRLEPSPHFVSLGTIEARKNHVLLLQVWEQLVKSMGDRAPELVIIGGRGWEAEEAIGRLDQLGALDGHVREISSCNDLELQAWLRGAQALLMPSFVEGFGLPVMEALGHGTPVIASELPVYREIVGDIPTYVDPNDASAWEEAIRSFCEDGPERKRQLHRIASYEQPRWKDHFQVIDRWLASL